MFIPFVLFFHRETFHLTNRFYLLFSLLAGLIIPLISISFAGQDLHLFSYTFEKIQIIGTQPNPQAPSNAIDLFLIIKMIYILGVLIALSKIIIGLSIIERLYRQGEKQKEGNLNIVYTAQKISPFSFFNCIFIPKNHKKIQNFESIIHHEMLHVNQWHTLDILFAKILQAFFWFNPIILFYIKALQNTHEYLADQHAVKRNTRQNYVALLAFHSTQNTPNTLGNQFTSSQIKHRITMIYKSKSPRYKALIYALCLPFLGFSFLFLSSCTQDHSGIENVRMKSIQPSPSPVETEDGEKIYKIVESQALFPGCDDISDKEKREKCAQQKMLEYIYSNIKYPESDKNQGIEGMVVAQFVVEKDGSISSSKILKSISSDMDKEVKKVIDSMPNWTPAIHKGEAVRMQYLLPVKFKLED